MAKLSTKHLGIMAGAALLATAGAMPAQSATGIDWSATSNNPSGLLCRNWDVAYGKGMFVAACLSNLLSAGQPHAVYSYANTWSKTNTSADVIRGYTGITFGDGKFVMVSPITSATASAAVSTNGLDWTYGTTGTGGLLRVAYGAGKFVAVGYGFAQTNPDQILPGGAGNVRTSSDGLTWSGPDSVNVPRGNWVSVAWGNPGNTANGIFVAVANNGDNRVMTSEDGGETWTARTSSINGPLRDITYANGKFVAVCAEGTPTGGTLQTCTRRLSGSSANIMVSTDGITWEPGIPVPAGFTGGLGTVTYGSGFGVNSATSSGSLFVAGSIDATASHAVLTSEDGATWTARGAGQAKDWSGAAFGNGFFNLTDDDRPGGDNTNVMSGLFSGSACGDGVPFTKPVAGTAWLQYAVPCAPAAPGTVSSTLGTAPASNLSSGSYNSDWVVFGRNATNSGNSALTASNTLSPGSGYWFGGKSSIAAGEPVDNKLVVSGGTYTSVIQPTGCQSLAGCAVVSVSTTTAGTKMIGNPFGTPVNWADVRIRVDGGTPLTPSEANAADFVSNQFWIWSGSAYESWNTTSNPGNLKYSQSFFIKVLPTGVGKTIELLIPEATSSITTGSLLQSIGRNLAALSSSVGSTLTGLVVSPAHAAAAANWTVKLNLQGAVTTQKASVSLGQYGGSVSTYDSNDLAALTPSFTPYLTMVFPQNGWATKAGDYVGDFRAATGAKGDWPFEIRTDKPGATVVLKWTGDKKILQRSRLTDLATGKVIDPTSRAYANGYKFTLKQTVRKMKWTYLGESGSKKK